MSKIDTSPLTPGYRLDRYELLGPLAEGGMASVWIARQRGKHGFEKLVAIKTILPQYAADDRFRDMFLDEARIASRIEHFNVARILDLGEEHDILYLVMEYVDGDSLSKLRRASSKAGGPLPPGVATRILADACLGLHEAHELKGEDGKLLDIVHRDVSPHNILVTTKGITKVIDFGIAKARDRMAGETNAGVLKGKIQYMAPEQALGRKVDRRADLWAVGATLYHLLTGKPPFDADNTLGTLHLLTSGRPPLPLPPSIPTAIAAVVRKALHSSADGRYATALEMHAAMEAALLDAGMPTTAADVAEVTGKLLEDRTAKRRQVIDIALAAAAERERVEALLKPQVDRTASGVTSAPGSARTVVDAPESKRSQTFSDTMPSTPSGMNLPVGSTGASEILEVPRSRRPAWIAAGLLGGLAVAGAVAFVAVRTPDGAVRSPASSTTTSPSSAPSLRANDVPAPSFPLDSAVASSTIPVISLSDLPKAEPSQSPPVAVPPRPPPPPPPKPPRKKSVDDGF